ncbi:hypothetical protein [Cupriavidus basilensis]|uniref:hypothetical protein n=1 Tax=Cupriavidus basilensis TaxID=68895 RepID=UPI002851096F|nr:hypothetical protein [Cupriavidus basilensis]MDR3382318.1 hypothetical protein [Cupriavidus basilensis]
MTLPAVPPISLVDIATELRLGALGVFLTHDDCKRLLGLSVSHPGPISLSDFLGKTRPWWGLVPIQDVIGQYYAWNQSDGGLAAAVDPYFANNPITAIQSSNGTGNPHSTVNFASDPGWRNNIKAQLLDDNNTVVREVMLSYRTGGTSWQSADRSAGDISTCLFVAAGIFRVNLIKQ